MNESVEKFQILAIQNPSLFNNMELIWIQHWSTKELVNNALYHFSGNYFARLFAFHSPKKTWLICLHQCTIRSDKTIQPNRLI